jgi:beta-galactosidase/beta-glucuronidase
MVENGKGYDISMETNWTGGIKNPDWIYDLNYAPFIDTSNIRFPFWLQPLKKYTGAAWYIKTIRIPANWEGRNVKLILERPHWESTIWINGNYAGMKNSLAVPHVFNITEYLQPGENTIAVRIDNRIKEIDPGINSHSLTDHTQTNWNGIVGSISLNASDKIYLDNIEVFPDVKTRKA